MSRASLDKDPHGVAAMFDDVAERYDLTNDVLSLGQDRLLAARDARGRRRANPGERVLDLAAGTGTSQPAVRATPARPWCRATSRSGMLRVGKQAGRDLPFVAGDAMRLPFADATFDAVTISFGLRNVVDPAAALGELLRVTRPGGRLVVCEFSQPSGRRSARSTPSTSCGPLPPVAPARVDQPRGLRLPRRVDPGLARPGAARPRAIQAPAGRASAGATSPAASSPLHRATSRAAVTTRGHASRVACKRVERSRDRSGS